MTHPSTDWTNKKQNTSKYSSFIIICSKRYPGLVFLRNKAFLSSNKFFAPLCSPDHSLVFLRCGRRHCLVKKTHCSKASGWLKKHEKTSFCCAIFWSNWFTFAIIRGPNPRKSWKNKLQLFPINIPIPVKILLSMLYESWESSIFALNRCNCWYLFPGSDATFDNKKTHGIKLWELFVLVHVMYLIVLPS